MSIFNRQKTDVDEVYNKYADILYRVALSHLANTEDAQDVVQDVFVKYMTAAPVLYNDDHERAWLIRVTINRCRDVIRRKKVREVVPLDEAMHIPAKEEGDVSELLKCLSCIPVKYRETVILHCLEGFSQQDTAKILGVSLSAVKMRISRARETLRKIRQEEKDV